MDNKDKFTTRMFHYISGELSMVVKQFDRIEDAIEAGISAACHSYKVYDMDDNVCHDSRHHDCDDSYA